MEDPMRRLLIVVLIAVSSVGAQRRGRTRDLGPVNPFAGNEKAIAEGRKLYNQMCTVCHGLEGTVGDRAPALAGNRRYLRATDQDLFDAIKDGIPGTLMPPLQLAETNIWKIVAYVRSLRATAWDAPVPGDTTRGEQVFWGKGACGQCHMIQGRGGISGPDLSNAGGQRTLKSLREALTVTRPRPSRGYQPARVVTASGETVTGILKNEDSFSLQVLDAEGRLHLLTRAETREVVYQEQPLMPSDYDKKLAPQELNDLLAFLSRQAVERVRQERLGELVQ